MWRSIGAAFFVLTFCTGTSFFTLPFTVSHAGFWPSVVAVIISWLFLLLTGLYYLEATLTLPPGSNVYSISRRYSGPKTVLFNVTMFIAVNYGYLIIFFGFGIPLSTQLLSLFNVPWPQLASYLFFALILGISVSVSTRVAIMVNFLLVLLMGLVFYLCFRDGLLAFNTEALSHFTAAYFFVVLPSLLNSLYFQTMIPTLAQFLKYDLKKVKRSIIAGLSLSCLLFIAWLSLVISSTALGSLGDLNWLAPETISFFKISTVERIGRWLPYLLLIMLTANALATGTVLVDFFSDLMKIPMERLRGYKRFLMTQCIFIPPLLCTLIPTQIILKIMLYITDVGGLYLSVILPILWIWFLRYSYQVKAVQLVPGGEPVLTTLTIVSCFVLYLVGLVFLYQALV